LSHRSHTSFQRADRFCALCWRFRDIIRQTRAQRLTGYFWSY